jgi:hypothetical protein
MAIVVPVWRDQDWINSEIKPLKGLLRSCSYHRRIGLPDVRQ